MEQLDKNIELPEPWYWTDQNLTSQLEKEMSKDHVLYGREVSTLARRQDNDDVLFLIDNKVFAVVHLTWNNNPHSDGHWPKVKLYDTWAICITTGSW